MRFKLLLLAYVVVGVSTPRAAAGQTAVCRDGTYSYSQHRSGTCSHHGGVGRWMSGDAERSPARTGKLQGRKTPLGSAASTRRASHGTPRHTRRPTRHTRRPATRSSAASRGYYTGPRGGCYTYTASGRKRYVDRSLCR